MPFKYDGGAKDTIYSMAAFVFPFFNFSPGNLVNNTSCTRMALWGYCINVEATLSP